MYGDAVASKVAALAEALIAAGHLTIEGLLAAMAPLVGLEVAQLAKSLATARDTAQIRLFAAVRADVDEQMGALGEGLVALAVGAHVFLRPVREGVELSWI